jgi:uncharacterized protein YkwD
MVFLISMASCSKDEGTTSEINELEYTVDLNLAQETDWTMANEILELINAHRASIGLPSIIRDQQYASAYAVDHSQFMMEQGQISHANFNQRKNALKNRGAKTVGENVAYGYDNAQSVVTAWLNSPSHRNIIEGNYTHSGFGVLPYSNGTYYFTQLFYKQ